MTGRDNRWAAPFKAALFDLDGTLADLGVDWGAARNDVARALAREAGLTPSAGLGNMLREAEAALGPRGKEIIARVLADHEGRARVAPIPAGMALLRAALAEVPVGIVSNNLHATVLRALDSFRLDAGDLVVVGFDDVERIKPDPQGIAMALARIGCPPKKAVYVGNTETDRQAALAAGTAFRHIGREHVETRGT